MKIVLGVIGIIAGVVLGLYVGVYLCFIGGIIGIVEAINIMIDGGGADAGLIAWSIVKLIFSGFAGSISAYVLILPSFALLGHGIDKKYKF